MAEITIHAMTKKELALLCGCSQYHLNKQLIAFANTNENFGKWKGHALLTKAQVKMFLQHTDILPETITV
jgi:hypothetical protein